jgi:dihydrolipoamide dehydrogenase
VEGLEKSYGVNVIKGTARFRNDTTLHIATEEEGKTLNFANCIVATGSTPIELPGAEFDGETIISSREALELVEIPDRFVVIGGGYIGMELGTVYQKLGSDVTVLEAGERILGNNDPQAAQVVQERAEELGMTIHTETRADEVEVAGGTATVTTDDETFEAEKVLVAIGRKPNMEGLEPENAGLEMTEEDFIQIDDRLQTNKDHIYAIGDVADQPLLAHKAYKEAKIAAEVIAGRKRLKEYQAVPACVYTDPEIAEAGMSVEEAEEQGFDVATGEFSLSHNGRAMTLNDTAGFVRLVATEEDNVLLGATICGPHASDLISELVLAIEMGALVDDVALTVHPHPTLSEAVQEAAEDLLGRSVHKTGQS